MAASGSARATISCRVNEGPELECSAEATPKIATPKELFYASLCSCTVATIRAFVSNSKVVSSQWASVELRGLTCKATETMGPKDAHHVPVSILLEVAVDLASPPITDAMKQRLVASAAFCPIKRMISKDIAIETVIRLTS